MRVGDGREKIEREREIVGGARGSGRGREMGDGSVCKRESRRWERV